jgi:hypothetical protein
MAFVGSKLYRFSQKTDRSETMGQCPILLRILRKDGVIRRPNKRPWILPGHSPESRRCYLGQTITFAREVIYGRLELRSSRDR